MADRFQIPLDLRVQRRNADRLFLNHLHQRVDRVRRLKRRAAGQQAIQNGTQ